jgi:protein SCO1/2
MKNFLSIVLLTLLFVSCGGTDTESETNGTEESNEEKYTPLPYIGMHDIDLEDTLYHTVPSFELMNQDSTIVNNELVNGKVHVANFFFTSCPSICPAMIEQMKRLQEMTNDIDELVILSHTIDPERDSIPKLRQYIADREIDTHNWHFLYGEREYVHWLGKEGYMVNAMEDEQAEGGFLHSEHFVLVDREGHIRGLYTGTDTEEVDKLNKDIRLLIENEYN